MELSRQSVIEVLDQLFPLSIVLSCRSRVPTLWAWQPTHLRVSGKKDVEKDVEKDAEKDVEKLGDQVIYVTASSVSVTVYI